MDGRWSYHTSVLNVENAMVLILCTCAATQSP
jgi:hypothetical protein